MSEFAVAYQAYVNGETTQQPEPIKITGSFEKLINKSALESVILDVVQIPDGGYVLSYEMFLEAMKAEGINVDVLSEEQLKEIISKYHESYEYPNARRLSNLVTLNYTFVANRLDDEPYSLYYVIFSGFILMCAAILIFWDQLH